MSNDGHTGGSIHTVTMALSLLLPVYGKKQCVSVVRTIHVTTCISSAWHHQKRYSGRLVQHNHHVILWFDRRVPIIVAKQTEVFFAVTCYLMFVATMNVCHNIERNRASNNLAHNRLINTYKIHHSSVAMHTS